jgi:uncharacterized protein with HEPN domain
MSKDLFRVQDYLEHIFVAIGRFRRYTQGITESDFLENEQLQDAVLRNIEIVGEAASLCRSSPQPTDIGFRRLG